MLIQEREREREKEKEIPLESLAKGNLEYLGLGMKGGLYRQVLRGFNHSSTDVGEKIRKLKVWKAKTRVRTN